MITYKELMDMVNAGEVTEHHTATQRGYYSRKREPMIETYKGRFGEGYKVTSCNMESTKYIFITYYIKKEVL